MVVKCPQTHADPKVEINRAPLVHKVSQLDDGLVGRIRHDDENVARIAEFLLRFGARCP